MNRNYSVTFIGYIIYGVICVIGAEFFFAPVVLIYSRKAYYGEILFGIKDYIFVIGVITFCIAFLFSDSFFASILAPISSYWRIGIREDGIYGCRFWEWGRILRNDLRKLCNWEDIKKIKMLGLYDMAIYRTRVILRNGKKFHITNIGHSPWEMLKFLGTKDIRERIVRYSQIMMYALIMKKIGEDKFEGFEKGRINARDEKNLLRAIKYVMNNEANDIIEEDRKRMEQLKQEQDK